MKLFTSYLLFIYLFTASNVIAQTPRTVVPLDVRDVLEMREFTYRTPIGLSPDGEWLAYTVESQSERELISNERYQIYTPTGAVVEAAASSVCVTNVKTGETKRLIEKPSHSWGGSWSPNGRFLAFYSDKDGHAAVWLWNRESGNLRKASNAIARPNLGFQVPQWTPDGRKILVKLLPEDLTLETAADLLVPVSRNTGDVSSKIVVYTSSDNASRAARKNEESSKEQVGMDHLSDLALIDISTSEIRRIVRRHKVGSYFLSPDGLNVAFMDFKGVEAQSSPQYIFDIASASATEEKLRPIAQNVRMHYGTAASWSPDGKFFAYLTSGQLAKGDIFIVDPNTAETRNVTPGVHKNFGSNYYRPPVWNKAGDKIYCIADGDLWEIPTSTGEPRQITHCLNREIIGIIAPHGKGRKMWSSDEGSAVVVTRNNETKQFGFYKIDLGTGHTFKLAEEDKFIGSPAFYIDVSDNGSKIVYLSQDGQTSEDVWISNTNFTERRRLTNINPQLDKYVMGKTQLIEWLSEDGEKLRGSLLLPAGYQAGKIYPVIVDVYGGSLGSNYVNVFGASSTGESIGIENRQLLATRGYAVFIPDTSLKVGTPMRDLAKTVIPGVSKLIELGIADPDRIGITGTSYGGYCTLALITQTALFRAALVASAAGANLFSMYGVMDNEGQSQWTGWAENGQGRMGGPPWQFRERYIENSPIFYLDRVTAAVMITAGTKDLTTPPFLTDDIFVCLQRLGKEAMYVKYSGGEHGAGSLDSETATDYFNRMIAWFDKYLKAPEVKAKTAEGR